jgi:precorrin-3B C17-methyltransferase
LDRTRRAEQAIAESAVIAGYSHYLDLIADLTKGKRLVSSGMRQETERCRKALDLAFSGETVALVSSGDPGIYGMAGLAIELAAAEAMPVSIEVIPGITASSAAASRLGAPLMLDYAVISLSDLLVPWETIRKRLAAVAAADLVTVLYNPKSKKRVKQLEEALALFADHRPGTTPVGIGTSVGTEEEQIVLTELDQVRKQEIGMRSIVIIGNRSSRKFLNWFVTPRGYKV